MFLCSFRNYLWLVPIKDSTIYRNSSKMPRDKYILIGSDISNSLATIIKNISGFENYTCVTAVKTLDTVQLARSLRPQLIILYFREVQRVLNNLETFPELKEVTLMCLTHKFQMKELKYKYPFSLFIQSYEDAMNHNSLRNNVNYLLNSIEKITSSRKRNHGRVEPIESSYKNYDNNLARYTIELDQKKAMLDKVKSKIKQLCFEADNATRLKLMSLLNTIKISTSNTRHWEDFKMYFEDINPHFIKRLSDKFPKLTSKDLKYCCYLKMNMSNEDIRNILGINQESVRTHKYRLKRKLTLSKDQNLRKFLESFSS